MNVLLQGPEATDVELLTHFTARQDEKAFETLVRRHGPLVLQVCRRILGNNQSAEDAFQATFIVLMRKAGSLSQKDLLSHWLYKVACRVALKARAQECRRHDRERQIAAQATAEVAPEHNGAEASGRDLRPVLDEEIARLPEKYRAPVVLSYLEGKTTDETAELLGWSRGTVATRLSRARDLLRQRLSRRGLAYSGAVLLSFLTELHARANVPAALVESTARGAAQLASGQTTALLTKGALSLARSGFSLSRLVPVLGSLVALLLLGLGVAWLTISSPSTAPVAQAEAPKEYFVARWPNEQRLREGEGVIELPTGFVEAVNRHRVVQALAFAPEGRYLAAGGTDGLVKVWDLSGGKLVLRLGQHARPVAAVAFSPSSEYLAGVSTDNLLCIGNVKNRHLVHFASKTDDVLALAFTSDSTHLMGGHKSGTLSTWDTRGELKNSIDSGIASVRHWAFASHAPIAACLDANASLTLWNYQEGTKIALGNDWPAQ
ncbi:MAG: sigma-70 family RNA polymerase sigma factor, partial [Gemmataceae bacterium]